MSREIYTVYIYMGVSKNRGTQNGWFIMENPIHMRAASRNVQRGVLKGAYKQPQGSFRRCLTRTKKNKPDSNQSLPVESSEVGKFEAYTPQN